MQRNDIKYKNGVKRVTRMDRGKSVRGRPTETEERRKILRERETLPDEDGSHDDATPGTRNGLAILDSIPSRHILTRRLRAQAHYYFLTLQTLLSSPRSYPSYPLLPLSKFKWNISCLYFVPAVPAYCI